MFCVNVPLSQISKIKNKCTYVCQARRKQWMIRLKLVYIQPDNLKCSLDDAPSETLQIPVQTGCHGWTSTTSSIRSCGNRALGSWET